MKTWVVDRLYPLAIIAVSFGVGFVWWWTGALVVTWLQPSGVFLASTTSPSTVSGADLIADLLTISALTVSVCIAYICLPRDRVEIKLSTIVKVELIHALVEIEAFKKFHSSTPRDKQTPSCRFVHGLLHPRDGLGGWYGLADEDMEQSLGKKVWRSLKRFVNDHLDEEWIKTLIYGLCLAMMLGFIDLGMRFFGGIVLHFSSFETAMILVMLILNAGTGGVLVLLVSGTHSGEGHAVERIRTSVQELKPRLQEYQEERRDAEFHDLSESVQDRLERTG